MEGIIWKIELLRFNYRKFAMDNRNLSLAAGVRSGLLDREKAIHEYFYTEPITEEGLLEYFKKRMNFSDEDLERIIRSPQKRYTDYKTYKKYFRMLRPIFKFAVKVNLVPDSFYVKYTSKD